MSEAEIQRSLGRIEGKLEALTSDVSEVKKNCAAAKCAGKPESIVTYAKWGTAAGAAIVGVFAAIKGLISP